MDAAVIDLGFRCHEWQQPIKDALATRSFGIVVAHRRYGKTIFATALLVDRALRCRLPDPRYAYLAPRLKQAKQTAWLYLCRLALRIPGASKNEAELYVELPNGARITLYGGSEGNEESMRGLYLDGVVVDEVAGIAPAAWGEIIRPALTDRHGFALFIGTPHGIDAFHALWERAQKDPEWFALRYRVDETELPWLPRAEIESSMRMMSDAQIRQEWFCDFSASAPNVLMTIDVIGEAVRRQYLEPEVRFAPLVVGVDVARYGDDRSVIQLRRGLQAYPPLVFQGLSNMDLAGQVAEVLHRQEPEVCFVDAGGGAGVIDRLRQLGYAVVEVHFGGRPRDSHYRDKRTEMWFDLRNWVVAGGALPNLPELKTDLAGPTYEFLADGKVRLEPKDDLKGRGLKSPDLGDALALTFAEPVLGRSAARGRARLPEYAEL